MRDSTSGAPASAHISVSAMVAVLNFVIPSSICRCHERAELVRLHVRTQPGRTTGDLDHQPQVVLDALAEKHQRRRRNRRFVLNEVPVVHR